MSAGLGARTFCSAAPSASSVPDTGSGHSLVIPKKINIKEKQEQVTKKF